MKNQNAVVCVIPSRSQGDQINNLNFLYKKEFSNGRQVYNFLKDYTKNVQKGKKTQTTELVLPVFWDEK